LLAELPVPYRAPHFLTRRCASGGADDPE